MNIINNIANNAAAAMAQGTISNTASVSVNNDFQLAVSAKLTAPISMQTISGGAPSLASQTSSLLLQLQDLNQTAIHSHGGGGGHHGGMKMMPALEEAVEATESEETQSARPRKKLAGPGSVDDAEQAKNTEESDNDDTQIKDSKVQPKQSSQDKQTV